MLRKGKDIPYINMWLDVNILEVELIRYISNDQVNILGIIEQPLIQYLEKIN